MNAMNGMNINNLEYYKKNQPKLHNNRRKRSNLNYQKKLRILINFLVDGNVLLKTA